VNFDWKEYLDLACNLFGEDILAPEEACWRSSISRAYYATFHQTRIHLKDKEPSTTIPRGVKAHSFIREYFKSSAEPERKKIGENLNRLRIDRNKADYDDYITKCDKLAKASIATAKSTIKILQGL